MPAYKKNRTYVPYKEPEDTMKALIVTLNIVLISTCLQANPSPEGFMPIVPVFRQPFGDGDGSRIINGKEATRGQFPYQAALSIDNRAFCGGSLISKNWALTAAHCIHKFSSWKVTLGAHNIKDKKEQGRVVVASTKAVKHENYDHKRLINDIGVISLPTDVSLNNRINIIKLPPRSYQTRNFAGTTVRVSGWGKVSDASTGISPTLQYVDLQVISTADCARYYGSGSISKTQYCTSGKGAKGTCNGDSGGSLTLVKDNSVTHLGIVSFGAAAGCSKGYPAGYTATTFFVEWISQKTGIAIQEGED